MTLQAQQEHPSPTQTPCLVRSTQVNAYYLLHACHVVCALSAETEDN